MDKVLYNYTIWLLARRSYHSAQLREKLKKRGAQQEEAEEIINHLHELRYINDEQYLQSYINQTIQQKPQGSRMLRQKLRQKGITGPAVDLNLKAVDEQEKELATAAFQKKLQKITPPYTKKHQEKLYRFLISRGFSLRTATQLIKSISFEKTY